MNVPRILIVDDDPALLEALPQTLRLRMEAVDVDVAESGMVALERIRASDYDAIIADVRMPGMDGLALLSEIRALRVSSPTLLITGHGEHDLAIEALRRGAYDYVQKPIDREYLIASLRRAIETHQLTRQVDEQRHALERHANELRERVEALTDAAATIHEARGITEVIHSVARAGAHLTGGVVLVAFLRRHAGGERGGATESPGLENQAEPWEVAGFPPEAMTLSRSHWLRTLLDQAVDTSEIIRTSEGPTDEESQGIISLPHAASYMVLPVKTRQGKVLGAILLGHPNPNRLTGDLQPQIEALGQQAAVALENALHHERQRGIAETLQLSLLPDRLPSLPGMTLTARYVPGSTEAVGGDWYDVFLLPRGQLGLVMGDVAGRGVRAAAAMGLLRNALRAYAMEGHSPAAVAERLNSLVDISYMATLIYLVFDPATSTLRYVNLGHLSPLVIPPGGEPLFIKGGSPPLGADRPLRVVDYMETLAPGASLFLYTDGLVERRGERLDEGLERLRRAVGSQPSVNRDPEDLIDDILARMLSGKPPDDDVAVLALHTGALDPTRLTLQVPAVPASLATLRHGLQRWLRLLDATGEETFEITVAASEALNNAVEHAFGPGASTVEIEALSHGGEVEITVRDRGTWRPPRGEHRGRGLRLIHNFMHAVDVTGGAEGTTVRMRRTLRHASHNGEVRG